MNHATMLKHIKAELDQVDEETLLSVWSVINQAKSRSSALKKPDSDSAPSQPLKFVGENLTPEEFERLSLKERAMLNWRVKEQNYAWLQEQFAALNAAWLVVVDGEVIASGKTLENEPLSPQLSKICRRTGKFPFIFTNDKFMLIEEGIPSWHTTIQADGFYPALSV